MLDNVLSITKTLEDQIDELIELRKVALQQQNKYGAANNSDEIFSYPPNYTSNLGARERDDDDVKKGSTSKSRKSGKITKLDDFFIDGKGQKGNADDDFFDEKLLNKKMNQNRTQNLNKHKNSNGSDLSYKTSNADAKQQQTDKNTRVTTKSKFKTFSQLLDEDGDDDDNNNDIKNPSPPTALPISETQNLGSDGTNLLAKFFGQNIMNNDIDKQKIYHNDDNIRTNTLSKTKDLITKILQNHENKKNEIAPSSKETVAKILLQQQQQKNKHFS